MFVVAATFRVAPGAADRFRPLILANAESSARDEPGCRRFDVCTDIAAPETFFLYEIYDDRAAFDAHRETPHYLTFNEALTDIVVHREARFFSLEGRFSDE